MLFVLYMKKFTSTFIIAASFLSFNQAYAGAAQDCKSAAPGRQVLKTADSSYKYELICQDQEPVQLRRYFGENGVVAMEYKFKNGHVSEMSYYDNKGEWKGKSEYVFLPTGNVINTAYEIENNQPKLKSREELKNYDPENPQYEKTVSVRKWRFKNSTETGIEFIEYYNPNNPRQITVKEYVDEKEITTSRIYFYYDKTSEKPIGFLEKDPQGHTLTKHMLYEPFRPEASLRSAGLPEAEITRRVKHQKDPNRFLMAVIDGGFDYNHPDLTWKWWNNPQEPVDGVDNDGNGWIDDNFGWEREKNTSLPAETSTDLSRYDRPDSHGTHVAHIATRNLEGIGLIGFAGDYTRATYIKQISAFLKAHQVKVVNISIGLPKDNKDDFGLRDGIKAYQVMMAENPETLFVVSSGNESVDIDVYQNKQYPGSINLPNVMKVGCLDTDKIEVQNMSRYKMTDWSNTGKESVDILAPGEDVSAARIGGGYVVHSGTSMSSPYMAHEAARLWMQFPHLKAKQVREIFIKSAYQMNPRPNIVSGGMVDFEKAVELAKTYSVSQPTTRPPSK